MFGKLTKSVSIGHHVNLGCYRKVKSLVAPL